MDIKIYKVIVKDECLPQEFKNQGFLIIKNAEHKYGLYIDLHANVKNIKRRHVTIVDEINTIRNIKYLNPYKLKWQTPKNLNTNTLTVTDFKIMAYKMYERGVVSIGIAINNGYIGVITDSNDIVKPTQVATLY